MKILVTGANGYLGQGIVKALLDQHRNVVATDFCTDSVDKRALCVPCDLFAVSDPYTYFGRPDVLLHLAWRDGFVHYSNAHIEDLPKHYSFIQKMIMGGLPQIAVMGSMHEVGFFEGCICESTPCHPVTQYGISKNALRELTCLLSKQNGTVFQWLRGYYIVSNGMYGNSIFSKIALAADQGKREFPFTSGSNRYDFLDYELFCKYVAEAVTQKRTDGIIEICSGKPETLAHRVERYIDDNKYNIKLQYGAFPDRPYDSKALWGDASKIQLIMENSMKRSCMDA